MPDDPPVATGHYAILFDADGEDRRLALDELAGLQPDDSQLLWVDLRAPDADVLDKVWQAFDLPERSRIAIAKNAAQPALGKNGEVFWVRVVALDGDRQGNDPKARSDARTRPKGVVLAIIAGKRFVLTVHDEPVEHLDEQRNREDVDSHVGALSAESFTVALLDWQLSTYFDAVADFELEIERLEVSILSDRQLDCLSQLRQLRKGASRLRRMLAQHRVVFDGMSRPDFRPTEGKDADRHFEKLDIHFERAMDVVENARELVVGSFELFSSQTALQTNKSMAILTFATVVLGMLAVLAGMLGMNFDAAFFDTRTSGFMVPRGRCCCWRSSRWPSGARGTGSEHDPDLTIHHRVMRGLKPKGPAGAGPFLRGFLLPDQAHGSCNTILASRSGPVDTIASGQPDNSSSARR